MSYDNWKTTEPTDGHELLSYGFIECPACDGEGGGYDEDGGHVCAYCKGEGVVEPDALVASCTSEELEELGFECPRCGCSPCDCASIEAMMIREVA